MSPTTTALFLTSSVVCENRAYRNVRGGPIVTWILRARENWSPSNHAAALGAKPYDVIRILPRRCFSQVTWYSPSGVMHPVVAVPSYAQPVAEAGTFRLTLSLTMASFTPDSAVGRRAVHRAPRAANWFTESPFQSATVS